MLVGSNRACRAHHCAALCISSCRTSSIRNCAESLSYPSSMPPPKQECPIFITLRPSENSIVRGSPGVAYSIVCVVRSFFKWPMLLIHSPGSKRPSKSGPQTGVLFDANLSALSYRRGSVPQCPQNFRVPKYTRITELLQSI